MENQPHFHSVNIMAIITFLAIIPTVAFYLGIQYETTREILELSVQEEVPQVSKVLINASSTSEVPEVTTYKKYVDNTLGIQFEYPSHWKVTEKKDTNSVTISSNTTSAMDIMFSTIAKTSFEPVNSKVGNISYDESQKALVDGLDTPARCLPYRGLMNVEGSVVAFQYAGSLMSTPAYSHYAVLTTGENMVLVHESSYMFDEKIAEEKKHIYESFKLIRSEPFSPSCAKAVTL
jgi:hypothetical protein